MKTMTNERLYGIRGATTADANTSEAVLKSTADLLAKLVEKNKINTDDIVHVIFTVSPDITADFPAKGARIKLGWDTVPMICAQELDVPSSVKYCIRVLITAYSALPKSEIQHLYLKNSAKLRPDLSLNK